MICLSIAANQKQYTCKPMQMHKTQSISITNAYLGNGRTFLSTSLSKSKTK